jgi:hypothetical protein
MQIIYPFIDTVTRQKFTFIKGALDKPAARIPLESNFDLKELEAAVGGSNPVLFESELYLSGALNECFNQTLAKSKAVQLQQHQESNSAAAASAAALQQQK